MFYAETMLLQKVVISMAKKYKKKFLRLKEQYDELNEYMLDIRDDNERYQKELRYLEAFIEWKNLSDEFSYFKKHAFEKTDEDLPFSRLTL